MTELAHPFYTRGVGSWGAIEIRQWCQKETDQRIAVLINLGGENIDARWTLAAEEVRGSG